MKNASPLSVMRGLASDRGGGFILGLVIAAAGAANIAAMRATASFDLVCTGRNTEAAGAPQPLSLRLSIDTHRKRWCYRDVGCHQVFPIVSWEDGKLTLLSVHTPLNEASLVVDMNTGSFTRAMDIPLRSGAASSAAGTCAVAPYQKIE